MFTDEGRKKLLVLNDPENKCECGNETSSLHSCPYKIDIYGDYETQCNCCEYCRSECLNDI